jgi:photosystem II stability/assembly factor-like uncharacterized protein
MTVSLSPNGVITHKEAAPPSRLVVATLKGLAILERKAGAWRLAGRALEGQHIGSLMVEPKQGGIFAGAHEGALYFSGDDGASWEKRMNGIDIEHIFSLAYAEETSGTVLYAGTEPVSLFRSEDYGKSWRECKAIAGVPGTEQWIFPAPPHAAHTKALTVDARDPRTIFAAIEQGALLQSRDGGTSWQELAAYHRDEDFWYKDVHRVVQLQTRPEVFYMTTGMGLYRTEDDGNSWQRLTERQGFRIGYPDHLLVSPTDDRTLFMAGALNDPSTWRSSHYADGTVMVSHDGGATWETADRGLPANRRANIEAMSMSAYPGGFTLFAGTTDGEVFASEDGAKSWTRIASALTPVSKGGHYRHVQDQVAHA